jgi:hypothetical protein
MATCENFIDLISGKEYVYSKEKVDSLKAKHTKEGDDNLIFSKIHCALGSRKQVTDYAKSKKSSPKKKGSPKKKVDVSPKKKSPKKKNSPPKRVSPVKSSPVKKASPAKKSPKKKVEVPCLTEGCDAGTTCRIQTGRCIKSKPKDDTKYEFDGETFFVTTEQHKKLVRDVKGKKASPPKKVSPKKKSSPKKSPGKKSPPKKVSPKKKSPKKSPKKSLGKKSPPKKVVVPKCYQADAPDCEDGKTCNAKTGNCVKATPKGGRKVKVNDKEFFVINSSDKKRIEVPVMQSAKSSEFLDRLYKVSSERDDDESSSSSSDSSSSSEERVETSDIHTSSKSMSKSKPKSTKSWVETSELVGEYEESEDEESGISRDEIIDINAHKKMILQILQKCTARSSRSEKLNSEFQSARSSLKAEKLNSETRNLEKSLNTKMNKIETKLNQLIKQKYDPFKEDKETLSINEPLQIEIADWIVNVLKQTTDVSDIDTDIVVGMADDMFYEYFNSNKGLATYNLQKIYQTFLEVDE